MLLRKKNGFTLVELLVVISIIALLVSILMPALGKAREQAYFVICATQIRQIGLAEMEFSGDHEGRLTPGDWMSGTILTTPRTVIDPPRKSGAVNLGHLVDREYLPVPSSDAEYILWCPAAMRDLKQIKIGRSIYSVFTKNYFLDVWDNRDIATGGIESNLFTPYDFRDSMDGEYSLDGKPGSGALAERISKNVILMDDNAFTLTSEWRNRKFSWHGSSDGATKYNLLFGDGSVQVLNDSGNTWVAAWFAPTWGITDYVLARDPRAQTQATQPGLYGGNITWRDSEYFDIIDQFFGAPALPLPNR